MKILKNYELVSIGDENMLIPVGDEAQRSHGLFLINEESAFLVRLLQMPQTTESLIHALMEEYDVDSDTAKKNVLYLISQLNEKTAIESTEL